MSFGHKLIGHMLFGHKSIGSAKLEGNKEIISRTLVKAGSGWARLFGSISPDHSSSQITIQSMPMSMQITIQSRPNFSSDHNPVQSTLLP